MEQHSPINKDAMANNLFKDEIDSTVDDSFVNHTVNDNDATIPSIPLQTNNKIKKERKPRAKKSNKLSDDQIRLNHVSSEKRRREMVRQIYDELVTLVPDLQKNENRSELIIYLKTKNYLSYLYQKNESLRNKLIDKNNSNDNETIQNLKWELGKKK
ncbi:hypothetical protein C6P45_003493 [Maudiozyma exigua]|uniref:BHLH domain-containing protein n=1 Tax=Maudiozyma exigua TaxID=34358 RepID=A0A9P7BBT2_MAUEX|nr:hypothetical protein C6P45_003493 [Kazachstania exigua]